MQKINFDKFKGTDFQKRVWRALLGIPKGTTITYKELAKTVGKPSALRAVANAVGANPCPARSAYSTAVAGGAPMIPCHRVLRSDGTLGGYSGKGGIRTKRRLLLQEGINI